MVFNSLNRQAALQNVSTLCPALSKVLTNAYRKDILLFIDGEMMLSQEGTTQGDPLVNGINFCYGNNPINQPSIR